MTNGIKDDIAAIRSKSPWLSDAEVANSLGRRAGMKAYLATLASTGSVDTATDEGQRVDRETAEAAHAQMRQG